MKKLVLKIILFVCISNKGYTSDEIVKEGSALISIWNIAFTNRVQAHNSFNRISDVRHLAPEHVRGTIDQLKSDFKTLTPSVIDKLIFLGQYKEIKNLSILLKEKFVVNFQGMDATSHVNDIIKEIDIYSNNKLSEMFHHYLSLKDFKKAYELALAYSEMDKNLSSLWIQSVKEKSINIIKNCAKKSVLLQILDPNLAAEELAFSRNIVDSFPGGSDIKNQLEEALQAAIADVTASQPVQVSSDWLSSISQRL